MLAGQMVELAIVDGISHETVRRTLKKRVEAAHEGVLVHSSVSECRVRGGDGRCAQTL
jgi:hypothetical protein